MLRTIVIFVGIGAVGLIVLGALGAYLIDQNYRSRDLGPPPDNDTYSEFAWRTGRVPSCQTTGAKRLSLYPNLGGDLVRLGSDNKMVIYDIGDLPIGGKPSLDNHDRLLFYGLTPDDLDITKNRTALMFCSKSQRIDLVILRFFCRNTVEGKSWNNGFEEITFSSGATYLSQPLYDAYRADPVAFDLETRLRSDYRFESLSDAELERWHVGTLSEILPSTWMTAMACYFENETLGLLPEQEPEPGS